MRPTHYLQRIVRTGEIDRIAFTSKHYEQAGVGYSPAAGMPELEAYQLINRWNVSQVEQHFVYAIE